VGIPNHFFNQMTGQYPLKTSIVDGKAHNNFASRINWATLKPRIINRLAIMLKLILSILTGVALLGSAAAQDVELQPDHPDRYSVVRGDTLWDISERFLRSPWLWPEIWQVNPQIDNPHLIYPGDVISLVYEDGQPRLRLDRDNRTVRLSPQVRATSLAEAIEPINLSDIRQFLDKRTILSAEEIDDLPYVVALQEDTIAATEGFKIYVRDMPDGIERGANFAVVRPTIEFQELPAHFPWETATEYDPGRRAWTYPGGKSIQDYGVQFWENYIDRLYFESIVSLGFEVLQAGTAEVLITGDPATLLITQSDFEIKAGDLILPQFDANFDTEYMPHSPESIPYNAQVIAMSKTLFGAGPTQVVAINKGSLDGVVNGDVFATHRPGITIRDLVKYPRDDVKTYFSPSRRDMATVKLPDEYTAHVMIFKTHEHISYALVMRAEQAVKVADLLKLP